MKILPHHRQSGIALIIVMIAVMVLTILAGGFAYSMKVEMKLAMNARNFAELEWLGRSGMEFSKWVLAEQMRIGSEPYDSLNQIWAGGPGSMFVSNTPLAEVSLNNVELGRGTFSVRMVDLERKLNINTASEGLLRNTFIAMGADAGEIGTVVSSIRDWVDTDNSENLQGAESDYYLGLDPGYEAKDGPMDDITELLFVQGVHPEMYRGAGGGGNYMRRRDPGGFSGRFHDDDFPAYEFGLVDVFTAVSSGRLNINTASATVLQVLPFMDENLAAQIIEFRSGPDGAEGTDDDTPFRNPGELINVIPNQQIVQQLIPFFDVRSRTFEVTITASVGGSTRDFVGVLVRNSPNSVQLVSFYASTQGPK